MQRQAWGSFLVYSARALTLLAVVIGVLVGVALSEGPAGFFPTGFLFGFLGLGSVGFCFGWAGFRLRSAAWWRRPGVRLHGLVLGVAYVSFLILVISG